MDVIALDLVQHNYSFYCFHQQTKYKKQFKLRIIQEQWDRTAPFRDQGTIIRATHSQRKLIEVLSFNRRFVLF